MNILVIGNGVDIAHGLPTKYTDFLEFCVLIHYMYNNGITIINEEQKDDVLENCNLGVNEFENLLKYISEKGCNEIFQLIIDNDWIDYFLQCDMHGEENWIDFESEISNVIKSIDESMKEDSLYEKIVCLKNKFFNNKYTNNTVEYLNAVYREEQKKIEKPSITYKELRDKLIKDLNRIIRAFEIYLSEIVGKINCKVISPDIEEIVIQCGTDKYEAKKNIISKVLSFNYSNTYERIYLSKQTGLIDEYMDYIHGKAEANNSLETNNMVLGIDEYLFDDRKDKDVEFIAFKKFYQRIHKGTGCKYKDWVDEIEMLNEKYRENISSCKDELRENKGMGNDGYKSKEKMKYLKNNPPKHNLYIFGHSLDVTDKDILRNLILTDNVYTTIYYHNREAMGQQIANLVKVIGQDELIRRTGGGTKTIEFKQQQEMVVKLK